ncbi:MAG TPA: hypothetical protein VHR84_00645 [Terriglobales bacterium]|nr:hypothetical protein [Terriglobales bacterium]
MTQTFLTRCMSFAFALFLAAVAVLPVLAQEGELDKSQPVGTTPEEIIQKFAAKEKEFKTARDQYTYRQSVKVQVLDGNTVKGEYQQVFDVLFDDKGKHIENVVFAPQSTLENGGLQMDQGDFEDIRQRLPFVLTSDELPEYDIIYVGQQKQDELNTYAFDIAPKKIEGKKRYFQGRVWVDDHDFQIVKTYGKTVPDIRPGKKGQEHLYPSFATWREQVDGKYWFPTYTRADDTLHFATGDIRIREIVRYENYKRFGAKSRITYEGQEVGRGEDEKKQPDEQKKPEEQKPQN